MAAAKKILLIEDDREIQSTISGVLQAAGYDVRVAPNGIEGQKRVEEDRPDLIITDMMMPRMGGFPVLEFLKSLPDAPPVIMITANEGGRHKAYAEMLGVSDYLRKPFAMDVLLESVAKALRNAETAAGPSDGGDRLRRAVRKKATQKSEEE
ncbi:MAG TPA: response regulator transcription factor [Planctomycetaceae bacterium]